MVCPSPMGEGIILICLVMEIFANEEVSFHFTHGLEDVWVRYVPPLQVFLDHCPGGHGTCQDWAGLRSCLTGQEKRSDDENRRRLNRLLFAHGGKRTCNEDGGAAFSGCPSCDHSGGWVSRRRSKAVVH